MFEKIYVECLAYRLENLNIKFKREYPIPVVYENIKFECGYRADLVVEDLVIVEAKSVAAMNDIFQSQMITYLRLSKLPLGLLINFNVRLLKDGIQRLILKNPTE